MSLNSGADCRGVGCGDEARRTRRIVLPIIPANHAGGMKAQSGPRRHTDFAASNFAQHEGAGRIAGAVDYDPFAGVL
jgi:hypothetical protein